MAQIRVVFSPAPVVFRRDSRQHRCPNSFLSRARERVPAIGPRCLCPKREGVACTARMVVAGPPTLASYPIESAAQSTDGCFAFCAAPSPPLPVWLTFARGGEYPLTRRMDPQFLREPDVRRPLLTVARSAYRWFFALAKTSRHWQFDALLLTQCWQQVVGTAAVDHVGASRSYPVAGFPDLKIGDRIIPVNESERPRAGVFARRGR
jgi:hypothetical protein